MLSSRSSRYFLTYGAFIRAVTFQSMVRISSPGSYSRTSSKSRPKPRKTLRYVPTIASSARMRALISTCLTSRSTSGGMRSLWCRSIVRVISGDRDVVENASDDDLRGDLLRLRLVRHDQPMAHDIERHRLDVLGKNVIASVQESVRSRGERDVDRRAGRDAVRDQRAEVRELWGLGIAGR